MQLVAKSFTIPEFENYINGLRFNGWIPNFIVVHNTSSPTQKLYKDWHNRKDWTPEQWLKNLASYYAGLGWNGCPHLFVAYDKILVLNDLTVHGTHTPSWNKFTWGVETVAEFEDELFSEGVKENLIAALAILHSRIGLNPLDFKLGVRGLHFHKEDIATTHKSCPGKNLIKSELIENILAYMNKDDPVNHHAAISEAAHTANTINLSLYELTDMKWLQGNLNAKCNAGIKVSGILDDPTKKAVENFQTKYKLNVDGVPGPLTRKKLKEI